jgi:hypothetical protein
MCNEAVELNNLVASCQQAGNKQCEHILLTSCWNSIATRLLQVCYNLCVSMCVLWYTLPPWLGLYMESGYFDQDILGWKK